MRQEREGGKDRQVHDSIKWPTNAQSCWSHSILCRRSLINKHLTLAGVHADHWPLDVGLFILVGQLVTAYVSGRLACTLHTICSDTNHCPGTFNLQVGIRPAGRHATMHPYFIRILPCEIVIAAANSNNHGGHFPQ